MERGDLAQGQAARRAPGQELPRRPRVGRARPGVGNGGREELEETLDRRRPGVDDHRGQRDGRPGTGDLAPRNRRHQRLAHSEDLSPPPASASKRS